MKHNNNLNGISHRRNKPLTLETFSKFDFIFHFILYWLFLLNDGFHFFNVTSFGVSAGELFLNIFCFLASQQPHFGCFQAVSHCAQAECSAFLSPTLVSFHINNQSSTVGYYMTEVVCKQPLQKKKPVPPLVYIYLWCWANPCTMKSSSVRCMLFLILKTQTMTIWPAFQLPHCLRPKIAGIISECRINRRWKMAKWLNFFSHTLFSHAY